MDIQEKDGQPSVNGLLVRSVDALSGEVTDMDVKDGHHRVKVEFPHDKVDTYRTTFDPECFRDSFAERKPVMCWQHDLRDPIGVAEDAQVLRNHNELVGRFSKFDEERGIVPVPNALRAYSQLRDKELTDFSFGFKDPVYEAHRSIRGVRNIKHAFMKEFSPVTIGSIPGAGAADVREEVMAQHSIKEIIELRDAGLLSEEDAAEAIRSMVDPDLASKVTIISPKTPEPERGPDGAIIEPDGTQREEDELPDVINATSILAALPEAYQRAIAENEARVFLVVGDDEWGPVSQTRAIDSGVTAIAVQLDAAVREGLGWLSEVDVAEVPEQVRQAAALFQAAGSAADTMLDIVDPDGTLRDDAENMASQPVKCSLCNGTGQVDDAGSGGGKVCPKCGGSGVEAEERADMECNVCHGSGKDSVSGEACPHCHGTGKVSDYKPANRAEVPAYWEAETYLRFVSVDDRKKMADDGIAMDNGDFPIPDKGHLSSALGHFSSYTGDKKKAKAHIQKRAKALGVDLSKDDFTRADMPEGMKECAKCDGDGKLPAPKDGGHRLTCPDCHGKGFLARAEPDDDDDSEDDEADESGDGEPSGEGAAADEDAGEDPESGDEDKTDKRAATLARLDRRLGR